MKNAPASYQPTKGAITKNYASDTTRLPPRLQRLARALLRGACTIRDLIDVIPSNNPAEYISRLREAYGLTIFCERVSFKTVDGNNSWHGKYHLTANDREKLTAILNGRADT